MDNFSSFITPFTSLRRVEVSGRAEFIDGREERTSLPPVTSGTFSTIRPREIIQFLIEKGPLPVEEVDTPSLSEILYHSFEGVI